jgi:hypothetical protein
MVRVCNRSLIRPSGTFSRWKKREKARAWICLLPLFAREKVAEGRMRDSLVEA